MRNNMKHIKLFEKFFFSKDTKKDIPEKKLQNFTNKLLLFLKEFLTFKKFKKPGYTLVEGKLMKISYFLSYKNQTFLIIFYDDEKEEFGIIIYNLRKDLKPKVHDEIIENIGELDYYLTYIFDKYKIEKIDHDNFSITFKFKEDKLNLILSELTKEKSEIYSQTNMYNI